MNRDRDFTGTILVLGGLLVLLHVLGAYLFRDSWWGLHAYAFLPRIWLWLGVLGVGVTLALLRREPRPDDAAADPRPWIWPAALAVGGLAGFWVLRVRHLFLGDASVMVVNVARGEAFHPRAPLSAVIQQQVYRLGSRLFPPDASAPMRDRTRDALAMGSVLAGALFLPVAWWLAGELAWKRGADAPPGWRLRLPVFLILVGQGFVLLFCGYVEHYTLVTLALAVVLWLALRALRTGGSLLPVLVAAAVALGLHLSAAVLLPGLLLLLGLRLGDPAQRRRTLITLGVAGLILVILFGGSALLFPDYDMLGTLADAAGSALSGDQERDRDYLFSGRHLRDLFNEQALIGPLGAFLFLPALAVALVRRRRWSAPGLFLAVVGLTYLVVSVLAGESNLGYPRNWDLLAPGGLVMATAALGLFLLGRDRLPPVAVLWIAAALSWFHTAPWLVLNTSFDRAFARLQSLPSEGGLTETNVGRWYLLLGEPDSAMVWLDRAVVINPANNNAWYLNGTVQEEAGDYAGAAAAYGKAVEYRSYKTEYREKHLLALVGSGQWEEAVVAGRELQEHPSAGPASHTFYAMALLRTGRVDEAQPVLERLRIDLPPQDPLRNTLGRFYVALGDEARNRGDWKGASAEYRKALEWNAADRGGWLRLVLAFRESGEMEAAVNAGRRALAEHPDWPEMLANTGLLLQDLGRDPEADILLARALELAPDPAWAAELRGMMAR